MRKYLYAALLAVPLVACSTETQLRPNIPSASPQAVKQYEVQLNKQLDCIAKTIWNEARGESWEGQYAVGAVIMNRVRKTGKSPCEIVHQSGQFAAYPVPQSEKYSELYQDIRTLSLTVKHDSATMNNVGCSEFFWKTGLMPASLRGKVVRVTQIGKHSFYRYKDDVCERVKTEKV